MGCGVYIHIPFCIKKCRYCDFLSFPAKKDLQKKYISALVSQIRSSRKCKVDTVFIGGGTPSITDESDIYDIMSAVYDTFDMEDNCEITIEINPASADKNKLMQYKKCGINRISAGVQSFNDEELKKLGRLHDSQMAKECIETILNCGFHNFNIDLMFAIPDQSFESMCESLETALKFSPPHISAYSLIIEENTEFYDMYKRGEIASADDELYLKMYEHIGNYLSERGCFRYEISNYAKKGFECRHNLKYWSGEEYFGFGLGAVGFMNNCRYENTKSLKEYLSRQKPKKYVLDKNELQSEFVITGFRKTAGISLDEFERRFGQSLFEIYDVSSFLKHGFMETDGKNVRFSEKGINVSNEILCRFV